MAATKKYDIVCGEGKHRSYTAALAELMMLNKYGNQKDYFWRGSLYNEYIKFIKLSGKICKEVGRDRFAWFIYKNPGYSFDGDIGLFIYNVRDDKSNMEFTMENLVRLYKEKFRPTEEKIEIEDKKIDKPKTNKRLTDFLDGI